jgi:hypothetical protein
MHGCAGASMQVQLTHAKYSTRSAVQGEVQLACTQVQVEGGNIASLCNLNFKACCHM